MEKSTGCIKDDVLWLCYTTRSEVLATNINGGPPHFLGCIPKVLRKEIQKFQRNRRVRICLEFEKKLVYGQIVSESTKTIKITLKTMFNLFLIIPTLFWGETSNTFGTMKLSKLS